MLSEEALQIAEERRKARENGKDIPNQMQIPETSKKR